MKKKIRPKPLEPESSVVREESLLEPPRAGGRVRTQIYLDSRQYDFLQSEAARRDGSMAEVIRDCIDTRMAPDADAWRDNLLLQETPHDPKFTGHRDGAVAHDAIIYGAAREG